MLTTTSPGALRFVSAVQPYLEAQDPDALRNFITTHYRNDDLCKLLANRDADVVKVAALALGMVGDRQCIPCLAIRLCDPDPVINQMAEHALWNVWFRAGSAAANQALCLGTHCLNDREFDAAFAHFNRALQINPEFAEAYHQRGMAWSLLDKPERALADYRRAVEMMPCHFSAWAGLGQCYAMLEQIPQAIEAYEEARELNPHIDGIGQALGDLRRLRKAPERVEPAPPQLRRLPNRTTLRTWLVQRAEVIESLGAAGPRRRSGYTPHSRPPVRQRMTQPPPILDYQSPQTPRRSFNLQVFIFTLLHWGSASALALGLFCVLMPRLQVAMASYQAKLPIACQLALSLGSAVRSVLWIPLVLIPPVIAFRLAGTVPPERSRRVLLVSRLLSVLAILLLVVVPAVFTFIPLISLIGAIADGKK